MTGDTPSEATVRIVIEDGRPIIETRIRPIVPVTEGPFRGGKILVLRTPLLPNMSDDEAWEATEQEFIDDDGSMEAFCPECAAGGHEPCAPEPRPWMQPSPVGRNAQCPCGSGKKFKKCCLN